THCTLVKYNFTVRAKELNLEWEEHTAKIANADTEHRCQVLKKLDIELNQVEESTASRWIQVLQLQIELAKLKMRNTVDLDMDISEGFT
ncbi:hypothetical protein PAXRUDRAFT_161956, partial [Paxillus rubicundulus Ve08.2h10]